MSLLPTACNTSATYGCTWPPSFLFVVHQSGCHKLAELTRFIVLGGMGTQLGYLAEWTGIIHSVGCYQSPACVGPPLLLDSKLPC
jgi:hypothetical protein